MNRRKSGSKLKKGNCFCSVLYLEICKFKDFFFFYQKPKKEKNWQQVRKLNKNCEQSKRPVKYSKKKSQRDTLFKTACEQETKFCFSKHCRDCRRCLVYLEQCFQCGKRGHLKGSKVCRERKSRDCEGKVWI